MAREDRLALMCAEALPWRCHRSLIADALLVRGIQAEDIMSPTRASAHKLTPSPRSKAAQSPTRRRRPISSLRRLTRHGAQHRNQSAYRKHRIAPTEGGSHCERRSN